MASIDTAPAPEAEATQRINEIIDEAGDKSLSPQELQKQIREDAKNVSADTRSEIHVYLTGLEKATKDAVIQPLDVGIGGLYDGEEQKIATSTIEVHGGIQQTVARMQEVGRHEAYHAMNNHVEPMQNAATEDDPAVLQLGGKAFYTDTVAIEGLTVHDTGNQFVSAEYQQHEQDLVQAASMAGVSMDDVRKAINEDKDLTAIDDRTRQDAPTGSAAGIPPASWNPPSAVPSHGW